MKVSKLMIVIVVGILLRCLLWAFQVDPAGDDGARYLTESINMVDYGVFSTDVASDENAVPQPSAHDLPLWPTMMAIIYKIAHSVRATQYIAGIVNIVLMCGAVWFLVSMLRRAPFDLSERSIAIGCFVFLFMPDSVIYSLFHMPDMTAVFFVTTGLWSFYRFIERRNILDCAIYAISAGLAIYSKPICIPLFGAFTVSMLLVLKERIIYRVACVTSICVIMGVMLTPWVIRNEKAFGTPGLTTISGTNLYNCNWGWMVDRMPEREMLACKARMAEFEASIDGVDKMKSSKLQGAFAKRELLSHIGQYGLFTLRAHPRLYVGTGTVALLRYLGLDSCCYALDDLWGSGNHAPNDERVPYGKIQIVVSCTIQIISWIILVLGYALVSVGSFKLIKDVFTNWSMERLVIISPLLSLILLALIIGPVTATRYRFIMIPFFAIIASLAVNKKGD